MRWVTPGLPVSPLSSILHLCSLVKNGSSRLRIVSIHQNGTTSIFSRALCRLQASSVLESLKSEVHLPVFFFLSYLPFVRSSVWFWRMTFYLSFRHCGHKGVVWWKLLLSKGVRTEGNLRLAVSPGEGKGAWSMGMLFAHTLMRSYIRWACWNHRTKKASWISSVLCLC